MVHFCNNRVLGRDRHYGSRHLMTFLPLELLCPEVHVLHFCTFHETSFSIWATPIALLMVLPSPRPRRSRSAGAIDSRLRRSSRSAVSLSKPSERSYLQVLRLLLFLFPSSVDLLEGRDESIEVPVVYQLPVLFQTPPSSYVYAPPLSLRDDQVKSGTAYLCPS
jgi:hypothetical protein